MTFNEIMMSLELGLIYGIVALGLYLTLRVIDFPDLTCDSSFVLGAASCGVLVKEGMNPWTSLLVAMIAGGMAGLATATLYQKLRVTSVLAGIIVGFMLYSINLRVMGGIPNVVLDHNNTLFTHTPIVPLLAIGVTVCTIVAYMLMTDFGLALRSIGQNRKLAQVSGIHVPAMTALCLALSNSLIALGGALFAQHQGFADIGSGMGTIIIGIASVMIGEKIMRRRSITLDIISCLLGSIIYRCFISLALHSDALGLTTSDVNLMTGGMIIAILYIGRRQPC